MVLQLTITNPGRRLTFSPKKYPNRNTQVLNNQIVEVKKTNLQTM